MNDSTDATHSRCRESAGITRSTVRITLGPFIGEGSTGRVYRAAEKVGSCVVAVKKSRVSLRVGRTILLHEARALRILQGHAAIPKVHAFGRFEHFEYLSMELLGPAVDFRGYSESTRTCGAAHVAIQMLSALQHVHNDGIVHRDIKPSNMLRSLLAQDHIYLIDFGLACALPTEPGNAQEVDYVIGTLDYASLNAHRGQTLSRPDDLESLAYTLLALLRVDGLPWSKTYPATTTHAFITRHTRESKRTWTGIELAEGYESAFGAFLDHARNLTFADIPDYQRWQEVFTKLLINPGLPAQPAQSTVLPEANWQPRPGTDAPVQAGQLVYVRLLPKPSIEGYTASCDPSLWQDPSLSSQAWPTAFRPAIILTTSLDDWSGKWKVRLAALTRREPGPGVKQVAVRGASDVGDFEDIVTVYGGGWPGGERWCYVFGRLNTFLWTPAQTQPIPAHWSVDKSTLKSLRAKLRGAVTSSHDKALEEKIKPHEDIFVEGHALTPHTLATCDAGCEVDWTSTRGWFDELVPIVRRLARDIPWVWTTLRESEKVVPESYGGPDFTNWRDVAQRGRQYSLNLGCEAEAALDEEIDLIVEVQ